MDRRERFNNLSVALLAAFEGWQSGLWTALPGIVQSFDAANETVEVQPSIQARIAIQATWEQMKKQGDAFPWVTLPKLIDVPVMWTGGGGFTLTYPITQGDEALVVFASRCIDAWAKLGGVQVQTDYRMHDLSDGFAFVGVRSKPRALSGISLNSAQLRSDDGSHYIEVKNGQVNVVTTGDSNVTVGGNANITASGTAQIRATAIRLQSSGASLKKLINDAFISFFNNHVHIDGTGVPTVSAGSAQETSIVEAE